MPAKVPADRLLTLAAQIVSAHVGHNATATDALPGLIRDVYETLASFGPAPSRIEMELAAEEDHDSEDHDHDHDHDHEHEDDDAPAPARVQTRAPARSAAKSKPASEDHLVCLEDGLTMKMLKRHLITVHGLTPDQYRAKWGLPSDYPMVAANYAKLRSSLAKESGLGLRPEARRQRNR